MHRIQLYFSLLFIMGYSLSFSSVAQIKSKNDKVKIEEKQKSVLQAEEFKHYVDYFNNMEDENIAQAISNSQAWEWMKQNIPLFECPQQNFEEMYYYRWWTLRKHIKKTPVGYAFTEFLVDRSYADEYNLIACAMGHHTMEARWLHNHEYLNDYLHVWYRGNDGLPMKKLHKFSNWTAFALYQKYLVDNDIDYLVDMLPDLLDDYRRWEQERRLDNGLFWQRDVQDGMEEQISGGRHVKNARPTINSYMYGNAWAISEIAALAGRTDLADTFKAKADTLYNLINTKLWNPESQFFETVKEAGNFAKVREEIGFIPWYFNIPLDKDSVAWKQLMDTEGFNAPYGITTAERRHPEFRSHGCCQCEWDGAVWPFATSQTLTGLANYLNHFAQNIASSDDYFHHLETYVESQYHRGRPYIGEYLDEVTGYWLKGDQERSRYYNHSTFNDLIITGLVGLRPRSDLKIEINPLLPVNKWDWFCLDNLLYQGDTLTIVWDRYGKKYDFGHGLHLLVNGEKVASIGNLGRLVYDKNAGKVIECEVNMDNTAKVDEVPTSLNWSERMALSTIKRNPVLYRSWGYMQGLLLTSLEQLSNQYPKTIYKDYILSYANDLIDDDGHIKGYEIDAFNIDNINAGKMLFHVYAVTQNEKYAKAIELLAMQLKWQPQTTDGGFWHKLKYPWQMWLDGAYMATPFLAQYGAVFNHPDCIEKASEQLLLMNMHMRERKTGLLYHGWDEAGVQDWSDPKTGLSSNFWGRSIGWYMMALVDALDYLPEGNNNRNEIIEILNQTTAAVTAFQDEETGVWYQVLDKGSQAGNYLEASASCMFVYAIAKGVNKGYLKKKYLKIANKGFDGILKEFVQVYDDGEVQLNNVCQVAGLGNGRDGSYAYYINEPIKTNDLKGTSPFIMAAIELGR
ncbi:glycoside hydrolase family 88 protein [Geofilum sp. OHC36d9]|uniref:glycoside hydrolase family 88 protein n=1 Tax=Geofilum sp. OHC36d9 TaxID=3458413 RepID=UPI0040340BF6